MNVFEFAGPNKIHPAVLKEQFEAISEMLAIIIFLTQGTSELREDRYGPKRMGDRQT